MRDSLAEMGWLLPLEATAPPDRAPPQHLVEMRKAVKVHRHSAGQPAILREMEAMIALPDQRIANIDREIATPIEASAMLAEQARLLAAVPGIGPTVLTTLFGELPEFGKLCRRRIASLGGLAPHARPVPGAAHAA